MDDCFTTFLLLQVVQTESSASCCFHLQYCCAAYSCRATFYGTKHPNREVSRNSNGRIITDSHRKSMWTLQKIICRLKLAVKGANEVATGRIITCKTGTSPWDHLALPTEAFPGRKLPARVWGRGRCPAGSSCLAPPTAAGSSVGLSRPLSVRAFSLPPCSVGHGRRRALLSLSNVML